MTSSEFENSQVSGLLNKAYKVKDIMMGLISVNNKPTGKCQQLKKWTQSLKSYKRTGIKIREAMLLSAKGEKMAHDGEHLLTHADITRIRSILVNGDACKDVLHLENLYYCVKQLTNDIIVLFNGAYYVIACLTKSKHLLIINIKARKVDGARTVSWMQSVAEDLDGNTANSLRNTAPYLLDWF